MATDYRVCMTQMTAAFRLTINGVDHLVEWPQGSGLLGLEQHIQQSLLQRGGVAEFPLATAPGRRVFVQWATVASVEVGEIDEIGRVQIAELTEESAEDFRAASVPRRIR